MATTNRKIIVISMIYSKTCLKRPLKYRQTKILITNVIYESKKEGKDQESIQ